MESAATQQTTGLGELARLKPSLRKIKERFDFCATHQGFAPDCIPAFVRRSGEKSFLPKKRPVCRRCLERGMVEIPPPAPAAISGISLVGNSYCWEKVLFLTDRTLKSQLAISVPQLVGILAHRALSEFGERGSYNRQARLGRSGVLGLVGSALLKPGTVGISQKRLKLSSVEEGREISDQVGRILEIGVKSGLVAKRSDLLVRGAQWVGFEFNFRVDLATLVAYFERWGELQTRKELGLNVNLRGSIDLLLIDQGGVSRIEDYKTGFRHGRYQHTKQMSWYGTVHRWHRRDFQDQGQPLPKDQVKMDHLFVGLSGTGTLPIEFQDGDPRDVLADIYEFWRHFGRAHAAKVAMEEAEWRKKFFPPNPGRYCRSCPALGKCSATIGEKVENAVPLSEVPNWLIGDEDLRLID